MHFIIFDGRRFHSGVWSTLAFTLRSHTRARVRRIVAEKNIVNCISICWMLLDFFLFLLLLFRSYAEIGSSVHLTDTFGRTCLTQFGICSHNAYTSYTIPMRQLHLYGFDLIKMDFVWVPCRPSQCCSVPSIGDAFVVHKFPLPSAEVLLVWCIKISIIRGNFNG